MIISMIVTVIPGFLHIIVNAIYTASQITYWILMGRYIECLAKTLKYSMRSVIRSKKKHLSDIETSSVEGHNNHTLIVTKKIPRAWVVLSTYQVLNEFIYLLNIPFSSFWCH